MKRYFLGILVTILFVVTMVSLPRVDYAEPSPFFYVQHLSPAYYVCVFASVITAMLSKDRFTRIISMCILSLLMLWTPFVVLLQPWHLDSYPFVAEAAYVARSGHIGNFVYLSESPAEGLIFGVFLQVSGMSPILLLKIYPAFWAIFVVCLLYMITRTLGLSDKSSIVAGLLLVSIFWPNNQHFSRQSIAVIFYLAFFFSFCRVIFKGSDRRFLALILLFLFPLATSHPATPIFLMLNLTGMLLLALFTKKLSSRERELATFALFALIIIWLLWNMIGSDSGIIYTLRDLGFRVVDSLTENPTQASGVARIFAGYTKTYSSILNIRFILTLLVFGAAFVIPVLGIIMRKRWKTGKTLLILAAWAWSNLAVSVPLLYAGLPYFSKPAIFGFISWGPLGALAYEVLFVHPRQFTNHRFWRLKKAGRNLMLCLFTLIFILGPALILPIVKYAPLPYLYPTSAELANKKFWDSHWTGDELLYLEFYRPIYYSYIIDNIGEPLPRKEWVRFGDIYRMGEGVNYSDISEASIWITGRLFTRDGFYAYDPSMFNVARNVTSILPKTSHNKIYDAGWPESILIPEAG